MKKNLIYIISTMVAVFGLSSCNDFLDTLPDQRTQIDSEEKVSKLLVTGYSDANYGLICEFSSDNMEDNNTHGSGLAEAAFDPSHDEMFAWKDVVSSTTQDSPQYIWGSSYLAIATANAALDAINELREEKNDPTILKAEEGEALLIRAYHHFVLVNIFGHAYKGESSKDDLGVPYMTKRETTVRADYTRISVAAVYDSIEVDLKKGLPLIDDGIYTVPAYHFNVKAAKAFAARFYLFKHDYAQAAKYAEEVLGGSPAAAATVLRDNKYIMENSTYPDNEVNLWYESDASHNLLIMPTTSYYGLMFLAARRYGISGEANDDIFYSGGPNWDGGSSSFPGYKVWSTGQQYGGFVAKAYFLFEYTDKIAGTGLYHNMRSEFTTNESLLCLAEALTLQGGDANYEKARQYMEAWTQSNTITKPLKMTDILLRYNDNSTATFVDNLENAPSMGIKLPADENGRAMLRFILHARRIETVCDGLRWFDIKRYGIEIEHNINGTVEKLAWDDERRALQLPQDVIYAGVEGNPRSSSSAAGSSTSGSLTIESVQPQYSTYLIPSVRFEQVGHK